MKFSQKKLWIFGGIVIFIIVVFLFGWVLFLRQEQGVVDQVFEGRGLGRSIPIFEGGNIGSTNRNIRESIAERFGFSTTSPSTSDASQTPRLWQISDVPAAGITAEYTQATDAGVSTSSQLRFYFVERPSGHIFSADPRTGNTVRISNTLIPQVYEVQWGSDNQVFLRHLDEQGSLLTFSGRIQPSTTTESGSLRGNYLEPNIVSLASNISAQEIFSLIQTTSGVVGVLANTDGSGAKRVFDSIITGWRSERTDNSLLLTQKAAQGTTGSAYVLSLNGDLEKIVGDVPGLTVKMNNANTAHLFGQSVRGSVELFAKTDKVEQFALPIDTFADKCVFDPSQEFIAFCAVPNTLPNTPLPDAWYRGEVHFSDSLWKIDTQSGVAEFVFSPESEFGVSLDILDPYISQNGSHLVFLDARTRTPWAFRLK